MCGSISVRELVKCLESLYTDAELLSAMTITKFVSNMRTGILLAVIENGGH